MLQKSLTTHADTIIYDLEDSVAPSEKDKSAARERLSSFLLSTRPSELPRSARIAVRLNDITTPFFERDLVAAVRGIFVPVLPKVHSVDYLARVASVIGSYGGGPPDGPIELVISVESARSLWNVGSLAGWRDSGNKIAASALLFAAEDYCADTSIVRTFTRQELLYTRSQIVVAAKAFGLEAIDMVCVNYKDTAYLREECEDGRRLGFTGKQAIHPAQVDIIHETFVPTEKEIYRAAKIVHQMEQTHASERGAVGLDLDDGKDGKEMIDAPMLKQAENTLRTARAAGLRIPEF
ncbi:citrate lyase beta subunit [Vararia minispora EC-137]|uniref:Citrate lyase beta subunit n=1 Tax=Vararia minispora EC-137 TaxID=1314806 RepID=A0ACB8QX43_9AGAM|nr:citrate lyase beta subunit [Vararia minispora EC-137]